MNLDFYKNKKKLLKGAFTLAEVLIVVGIIGIVAEMTIPTLQMNVRKQEASARLKKFYSTMSQAILRSEVDNGPTSDWTYTANSSDAMTFFYKYLGPYMRYLKTIDATNTVYLNDGSSFSMGIGSCIDFSFDINGDKNPNAYARDRFVFLFCSDGLLSTLNSKKNFGAYFEGYSRADALSRCKNSTYMCSTLLELDGWEFKSDYPYEP